MLPAIVERRVEHAQAVASNLRAAAVENPDRPALAQRLLQASQTIDDVLELLEQTAFAAKLNRDAIIARNAP